jgi:hypothetical protein
VRPSKRVFFVRFDSSGKFPDGRVKLDVYFRDSEGQAYIWTPDWEKGTRQFFVEAYEVEKLNVPTGPQVQRFVAAAQDVLTSEVGRSGVEWKALAVKLAPRLQTLGTMKDIALAAMVAFSFNPRRHGEWPTSSPKAEALFDWFMSLSEQPIAEARKLELLRKFVSEFGPDAIARLDEILEQLSQG